MFSGIVAFVVFILVSLCPAVQATEQLAPRGPVPARPAVCIALTDAAPVVDGDLSDACWESAVAVRPFNLSYEARFAPYRAEALLTYTADHLYVAIRCFDPDPKEYPWLPYPPDRDAIVAEVLIDAGQKESFYKLAVTDKNEVRVTQPMANALPWRAPVAAVMRRRDGVRGDGVWTAEFAIPFAGTDVPTSQPTAAWRINLGWRTKKCIDYSAWAVTHAWFYEPQFYGDLYFGGPNALTAELTPFDVPKPDDNPLTLTIINRADQDADCETVVTLEDKTGPRMVCLKTLRVPGKSTTNAEMSYRLDDGLAGVATVTVQRKGATEPFFRQSIPIELAANRKTCREIEAALSGVPKKRFGLGAERVRLTRELARFQKALGGPDAHKTWQASVRPLEQLLGQAQKLAWRNDHAAQLKDAPFGLGAQHSLQKVFRDRAYTGPLGDVIDLSAARGEYEGCQLLIVPLDSNLADIEVLPSVLTGPDSATIPSENVRAYWTDFVESRLPRYPIEYVGWIADPLIPLDAGPRAVAAEALHQPLWIAVRVPTGIPAGVYTGEIEVRANAPEVRADAPRPCSRRVTLRVRVYDFDLPKRPVLQTSLWFHLSRIKEWYGWKEIPKDVLRKEMAFLLDHRVNPAGFGPVGDEDDIEFQLENGLNCVMLGVAGQWPLPKDMEEQIAKYYDFFKQRNLLDLTFIYGQDEPSPGDYPKVRDTLERVAERFPGVRRVCTAYPPVPMLEGAIDTWVVGPNVFNYGPVAQRVAAGDELWIYHSASVRRPYASQLYLDYTALENRLVTWQCWKYGATGFLYWGISEWEWNNQPWSGRPDIDDAIRAGKRWPEVRWNTWTYLDCNGDAQYVYPGPNGDLWSSVRMEILRDAIEDYDYFALLKGARDRLAQTELPRKDVWTAEADKLLAVSTVIGADLTQATDDPVVLLKHRTAIAELIETITRTLNAGG